jgi:nucleotide-binding universal stress UspA family protein
MVRTILVFFDGSAEARKAFDLSIEIAEKFQAKIFIMGVASEVQAEAMLDRGQNLIGDEFPQLCHEAREKGIQCQYRFDVGDPIEQIVRAARDRDASLIIIGQAGLTEKSGSAAGSQAERVIRYAPCPVTVI